MTIRELIDQGQYVFQDENGTIYAWDSEKPFMRYGFGPTAYEGTSVRKISKFLNV
jgi:hypothetical protein